MRLLPEQKLALWIIRNANTTFTRFNVVVKFVTMVGRD